MNGEKIPDQNHIARFVRPMQAPDGQIQATAFMLRPTEKGLSVNWLEFLNCSSRDKEISEIREIYSKTFLTVGARAKIAVLNVGEVREKVLTESSDYRNLEVIHDPLQNDPSHSEIHKLKQDDELIAELILQTVRETYQARI